VTATVATALALITDDPRSLGLGVLSDSCQLFAARCSPACAVLATTPRTCSV
jgi:hypothetical protein